MNVLGVGQPAALQISVKKPPHANAQEEVTLVKCALTPEGHGSPWQ